MKSLAFSKNVLPHVSAGQWLIRAKRWLPIQGIWLPCLPQSPALQCSGTKPLRTDGNELRAPALLRAMPGRWL